MSIYRHHFKTSTALHKTLSVQLHGTNYVSPVPLASRGLIGN
jgi:hypothetical protein